MSVAQRQNYPLPLVVIGENASGKVFQVPWGDIPVTHYSSVYDIPRSDELFPLVVAHTTYEFVEQTTRAVIDTLRPIRLICAIDKWIPNGSSVPYSSPDVDVIYVSTSDLLMDDIQDAYAAGLQQVLQELGERNHISQQLTTIIYQTGLGSDSEIYQELQSVSQVLGAEGVAVLFKRDNTRLYGVNVNTTRNFRSVGYTATKDSVLHTALHQHDIQVYALADVQSDQGIRDCLDVQHASSLYVIPVMVGEVLTGAVLVACDLSYRTVAYLQGLLGIIGQRVTEAIEQRSQKQQFERKELLRQMMGNLITAANIEDVQAELCRTIEQIPTVKRTLIWQKTLTDDTYRSFYTSAYREAINPILQELDRADYFEQIVDQFSVDMEPLRLSAADANTPLAEELFAKMRADTFVVVPLVNAAFIHGLIFVVPLTEDVLQQNDIQFIHTTIEIAGQVMERQWFTFWEDRRISWLETIARHTREGFLYVDENGRVNYVTPRFVELTGIEFDKLIDQNEKTIFAELAANTDDHASSQNQLLQAHAQAFAGGDSDTVRLLGTNGGKSLLFEIVLMQQADGAGGAWLGVVREPDAGGAPSLGEDMSPLKRFPVDVRAYQARALELLNSLTAHNDHVDEVIRSHMLNSIKQEIEHIGRLSEDVLSKIAPPQVPAPSDVLVQPTETEAEDGTLALPPQLPSERETDVAPSLATPVETVVVCMGNSRITRMAIELLREEGYELSIHRNVSDFLWYLEQQNSCDLIIVDENLFDNEDSFSVVSSARNKARVPVVMLTDEEDITRAQALESGIDAYLSMPIDPNVFLLEVNAVIRRSPATQEKPIQIGDLEIDLVKYTVVLDGEPVELTRIEYKLLRVLAINKGQVLEHEQLLRQVWGPEYVHDKQQLWVYVSRLRKKLEPSEDSRRYIHTRSGVGYVLK